MIFYRVSIDVGKRKKFACGCLAEIINYEKSPCPACSIEVVTPNLFEMFEDKAFNIKMHMDRDYYADFMCSQIRDIVSERAKEMLSDNFSNSVDFASIGMVSLRDLSPSFLKYYRDRYGSKEVKRIPDDPPQYHRLLLKQGADLDFKKSNIQLIFECSTCGRKKYDIPYSHYKDDGFALIYLIESTWNGRDIFYVEGMGNTVFCTERFIEVYSQHELTGLEFAQISTSGCKGDLKSL